MNAKQVQVKAKAEKWKEQYRYRAMNEKGALPVDTGEDYQARLYRSKRDNMMMLEDLELKLHTLVKGSRVSMGKIRSAVAIIEKLVEIRREEARAPENRSRKELAFKGILVPAPYAEPGMDGQFILDQMPGAASPPSPESTAKRKAEAAKAAAMALRAAPAPRPPDRQGRGPGHAPAPRPPVGRGPSNGRSGSAGAAQGTPPAPASKAPGASASGREPRRPDPDTRADIEVGTPEWSKPRTKSPP